MYAGPVPLTFPSFGRPSRSRLAAAPPPVLLSLFGWLVGCVVPSLRVPLLPPCPRLSARPLAGSGKTTLLNLLAGRLPSAPGVTSASGSVRVNGSPRDGTTFKQLAAYVVQDSSLFAHLTVRETLAFSARLRLPPSLAAADVDARVDAVCAELGLSPAVSATRIGGPFERGISGGERKRVTIGVELVTDPSLLFLDVRCGDQRAGGGGGEKGRRRGLVCVVFVTPLSAKQRPVRGGVRPHCAGS